VFRLLDPPTSSTAPLVAAVPTHHTSNNSKLSQHGSAARVVRIVKQPLHNRTVNQPFLISLVGESRIRLSNGRVSDDFSVEVEFMEDQDTEPDAETLKQFKKAALALLDRLGVAPKRVAYSKLASLIEELPADRAGWMSDVLVSSIRGEFDEKIALLAASSVPERLHLSTKFFTKLASLSSDETGSKQQREAYLRQQLSLIQKELATLNSPNGPEMNLNGTPKPPSDLDDEESGENDELAELRRGIERMRKGSEERKMAVREWRRMKRIPTGSAENGVVRGYLEWLTSIPWPSDNQATERVKPTDNSFISRAKAQLDSDHFGLEKVKKRLMEYLAVVRLRQLGLYDQWEREQAAAKTPGADQAATSSSPPKRQPNIKGPILLFVGPPGTGKTSLGQSIAKALNRPFQRISLGGVRDEAEIRGHRRTYVASGPGLIVQALRKSGRMDPVILLDEIDKLGLSNFHGDPGAALLEVLDPEQNHSFNDHYINVPIDLSQVLFICTANSLETMSAPLMDRCEVVNLSGYTYDEKTHIARRFLLPKQLSMNGLEAEHIDITDDAMKAIATMYTREAGVRSLDRAIGAVVRSKAVEWAEWLDSSTVSSSPTSNEDPKKSQEGKEEAKPVISTHEYHKVVEASDLQAILGHPRWDPEERERDERRGLVYGLVVSGDGEGGVMPVETTMTPGTGNVKLTGSLGAVIKESADLAVTWLRTHAYELCLTNSRNHDPLKTPHPVDIHLHMPSGAVKKDGPSAGIAMTCALVSLLTGAVVPSDVAMTGEITLRGRVTAVGGIKEKVLGAHRAQIKKVILPYANKKDVESDVAKEVKDEMEFVFVKTITEALTGAFGTSKLAWRANTVLLEESRL
jgi:ATP-dependent Lon protease